ncbi:Retrovirus-related Pol polyprotein from transposon 17.6, partial [Operophtera brumata]
MSQDNSDSGTPKGPTLRTRTRRVVIKTSSSAKTAKKRATSKMTSTGVNMSPEQLQELVASLTTAAMQAVSAASASGTAVAGGTMLRRSFSEATVTFSGARDAAQVEEFLAAASIFKKIHNISDADAIMCMPLILKGEASTWWQSVKSGVETWAEFEQRLRHAFAPRKPAYMVYQEVFAKSQPAEVLTEVFVASNRALLAQLPAPGHTEQQQLDMIYGQLHVNIRKRVPRDKAQTFDELLTAARGAEQLMREKTGAESSLSDGTGKPGGMADVSKVKKVRCDYCRRHGHTVEECRKKQNQAGKKTTDIASTQAPSPSQPIFTCYGCGAPGVVRSKCPTCLAGKAAKGKEAKIDFCALNINTDARPRPTIGIGILDIVGNAYLDTCAKSSVASYELYRCLERRGVPFGRQTVTITLADGVRRRQEVLSTKVPVRVCQYVIPTTFIVFPEARENKTLLGVGFLQDAGIVIDLPQLSWCFVANPSKRYDLILEEMNEPTAVHAVDQKVAPASIKAQRTTAGCIMLEADECPTWPGVYDGVTQPSKRHKATVFDGYSPFVDYMYADAVRALEEEQVELSPNRAALFPGYTSDDIGLNAFSLETVEVGITDPTRREQVEALLSKHEEVFQPGNKATTLAEH